MESTLHFPLNGYKVDTLIDKELTDILSEMKKDYNLLANIFDEEMEMLSEAKENVKMKTEYGNRIEFLDKLMKFYETGLKCLREEIRLRQEKTRN
jgi:hypothetical protein